MKVGKSGLEEEMRVEVTVRVGYDLEEGCEERVRS